MKTYNISHFGLERERERSGVFSSCALYKIYRMDIAIWITIGIALIAAAAMAATEL